MGGKKTPVSPAIAKALGEHGIPTGEANAEPAPELPDDLKEKMSQKARRLFR